MDIFLELIALLFGGSIYKKVKKWVDKHIKMKKGIPKKSQNGNRKAAGQTSLSCTGCNQILKEPPVYEQGKPWCRKCYKTKVLKLR